MNLESSIINVKGVGEKSLLAYERLNLRTVNDLIHYYPRTYEKFETLTDVKHFVPMERNAVYGVIASNAKLVRFSGKSIVTAYVKDKNGDAFEIRFFNAPYLAKILKKDSFKVFRGFVSANKAVYQMSQPQMYDLKEYEKIEGTIGPIYSVTKDITSSKISKSVKEVIDLSRYFEEYLSEKEMEDNSFLTVSDALRSIHFPKDEINLYKARRRLIFEEFLDFYHGFKSSGTGNEKPVNEKPFMEVAECERFKDSLPFELTNAQKSAIKDIFDDMTGKYLMNRLVQGDVGSGKTLVAIEALLMCAANNAQGALMAPTEVLAVQHFNNIKAMCDKYGLCIKPVLLYGKLSAKAKREACEGIRTGEYNVVIGTHALFQEGVEFKDLKLVITDEQHRFGVNQRESLRDKGVSPHILVMSATPIPRTLAMVMYGNVDISVMDELPKNRIPIKNCVVNSGYNKKSLDFIKKEIEAGHQAYVICPMIDESEEGDMNLKDVGTVSDELRAYYGDSVRVATLHGKLKSAEKERIMDEFKDRKYDILVSTTVIEVGVDVPNATVMMIENAERFGLSQLHQLRGRVGRGDAQSYCILVSDTKNEQSLKRLKVLNETNDGFEIARQDIKLRGPGELAGVRQSGALSFGLGDIMEDSDIFMLVIEMYDKIKNRLTNRRPCLIDFRSI